MDLLIVLQAGVATGTVLLFATLGEIFAERSGVMNLGVEGMMLIGAMSAFSVTVSTGNPWLGVIVALIRHASVRSSGERPIVDVPRRGHQPRVRRGP
jgi:ABC-type uncharacterized transport system permease subunit